MDSAIQPAAVDHPAWTGDDPASLRAPDFDSPSFLCLPISTRSASLLSLLLQESSVDVELTSAVVALDPGLAFTTLQLANRERYDEDEPVWQFSLALVASGRRRLLQAVHQAPKIESFSSRAQAQLRRLWVRAVVRACVARLLGQQLGGINSRQAFLAGLLFELAAFTGLAFPSSAQSRHRLQAASRATLPLEIAATIGLASDHVYEPRGPEDRPQTSLAANVHLAELLLDSVPSTSSARPDPARELASNSVWQCWQETSMHQRHLLLDCCGDLARWAAANAVAMNPWEFIARLERSKGWE